MTPEVAEADEEGEPWEGTSSSEDGEEGDENTLFDMDEFVLQETTGYMAPTLRFMAIFHTVISLLCLVGYYYLKVLILLPQGTVTAAATTTTTTTTTSRY